MVNGKQYLLVMVDRFSKWVEAIPAAGEDAKSVIGHNPKISWNAQVKRMCRVEVEMGRSPAPGVDGHESLTRIRHPSLSS